MTGAQLERKKRAPFFIEFYRSAVGKKWVMAVTGIILIGFVIAHMVGNLKIYLGPEPGGIYEIDEYAESLRTLLYPILPHHVFLWILRIAVLGAAVLHVHAAVALTVINNRARSTGYQGPRQYLVANYASRTMRWSGFIVLAYVLFHLADFTWGIAPFAPDGWARGAVRANFIASFTRWPVVLLYVIANLLLGVHLYHGTWSMFQSLGINSPRFNAWRRWFAQAVAVLITAGNVSIPLAISFGLVA